MQAVLEQVSPQRVYLFGVPGPGGESGRFVQNLAGLVKHTLRRKKGLAELGQLAAASAQRAESVRAGLHLLAARGDVQIVEEGDTSMRLAPGDGRPREELDEAQARLGALLQETAAYRTYFVRAPSERLI
jgi:hypothetical protein